MEGEEIKTTFQRQKQTPTQTDNKGEADLWQVAKDFVQVDQVRKERGGGLGETNKKNSR